MEGHEYNERREEIFSRAVKAGKRTYFFDVKSTKAGQYYLTITESKRRFSNEQGKFYYEKHKIFLFREDFEKFIEGLDASIRFIEMGTITEDENEPLDNIATRQKNEKNEFNNGNPTSEDKTKTGLADISFEDLGNDKD